MMTGCRKILMLLALLTFSGCVSLDMTGKDDCESDTDCLNGYFCNSDGKCEEEESGCVSDADCKSGRICLQGSCTQACSKDEDCPNDFLCDTAGHCVEECTSHNTTFCQSETTYWVDSCGNLEEIQEQCQYGCNADFSGCADPLCDPGTQMSCSCPGGDEGFQTCLSDGSGWTACDCQTKCPAGQVRCGAMCVDLTTDDDHCGACDNACGVYAACVNASCLCVSGYTLCFDVCVNTNWDSSNCGECGFDCGSDVCVLGDCKSQMNCEDFGLEQCDDICVDTQSDPDYCGNCVTECGAGELCITGECMFSDCEELGLTFCGDACVDTETNTAHCGDCDSPCDAGEDCIAGVCLGDCCGDQPLYGFIAGQVWNVLSTEPEALDLAVVPILEALMSPVPMHMTETTSDAQGRYQTDCMDFDGTALGIMLLADDQGFDGTQGEWYPTYSPVMEIESDDDRTCVPDAPEAWAVPTLLMFSLDQVPNLEGIISGGFALIFILDAQGNPVEGAELKKDGDPPEDLLAVYPDETLTSFDRTSTSSIGVAIVPGPMVLTYLLPVKSGMQWEAGPIGIVEGFCFTRSYHANY